MEKHKQRTINRLFGDVDNFAYEAEHQDVCEYALEIGGSLDGLLTSHEALELMGVLHKQIAARNRLTESLGILALRED